MTPTMQNWYQNTGGRGKKGGGFATVSSAYRVRLKTITYFCLFLLEWFYFSTHPSHNMWRYFVPLECPYLRPTALIFSLRARFTLTWHDYGSKT